MNAASTPDPDLAGAEQHPHPQLDGRRILIGLSEISGYASGLRTGFRDLGYPCDFLELSEHRFAYLPSEDPHRLAPRIRTLQDRRDATRGVRRKLLTIRILFLRTLLFLWALVRYDVFILHGHAFFLGRLELWLYRAARKKVVVISHGSDTRPPYIDGTFVDAVTDERVDAAVRYARKKKRLTRAVERSGAIIVNSPAWGHFQERPFATYLVLGFPVHRAVEPVPPHPRQEAPLRVLHSPSRPIAKGSRRIRAVADALRSEGRQLELEEIVGQPNQVVLERLARSDIVLDQMYASTPMAGFATEASLFGRPAIVGSYYVDVIRDDVPPACIPPTLFVHPDRVQETLRTLLDDADARSRAGAEADRFVATYYDPATVASRYVRLIAGEAPPEWWFDPQRIRYTRGGCIEESLSRPFVARLLARHGRQALCLGDKPALEQAFVAFASERSGAREGPTARPLS